MARLNRRIAACPVLMVVLDFCLLAVPRADIHARLWEIPLVAASCHTRVGLHAGSLKLLPQECRIIKSAF